MLLNREAIVVTTEVGIRLTRSNDLITKERVAEDISNVLTPILTTVAEDPAVLATLQNILLIKEIVTEEATEHILLGILTKDTALSVYTRNALLRAFTLEVNGTARVVTKNIRAFTLAILTVKLEMTEIIKLILLIKEVDTEDATLFITIGFLFTTAKSDVADTACKV